MSENQFSDSPHSTKSKYYGGWSILFGSIFGSFLGAGYMLYQNYRGLGKQNSGIVVLLIYVFLMIGVATLSVLSVGGGYWFAAVLLALIHYSSAQRSLIKSNEGPQYYPVWNVMLVCLASLFLLLTLFFFLTPLSDDATPRVSRDSVAKEFAIGYQEEIFQSYFDENGEYPTRDELDLESVNVTGAQGLTFNLNYGQIDNSSDRSRYCIFHFLEDKKNGALYAANQNGHGYIGEVPEDLDHCDKLLQ
jgi:hypothetical protein